MLNEINRGEVVEQLGWLDIRHAAKTKRSSRSPH